ncbi:MAG: HEAT repeat domain-containing protein [Candidatus Kariarchaeaceae archaeon]|jgi:HEAT repeat protein
MDLESPQVLQDYHDSQLSIAAFRERYPALTDSELMEFLLEKAEVDLKNFTRSQGMIFGWGENGIELLRKVMTNDESPLINIAIRISAQINDNSLFGDLLTPLRSWNDTTRAAAIEALQSFVNLTTAPLFETELSENRYWRIRAGLTQVLNTRFDTLSDFEAVFGRRYSDTVLEAIAKNLGFKEPRVQSISSRFLGRMKYENARSQLMKLLSTRSPEVTAAALEALIFLGGNKTVEVLDRVLQKGQRNEKMKIIALTTAVAMVREINIDTILRLRYDTSEKVRVKVAWILQYYKEQKAVDELVTMLLDPSEAVAEEAAESIISYGNRVIRYVIEKVKSENKSRKGKKTSSILNLQALTILTTFDIGPYMKDFIEAGFHEDKEVRVRRLFAKQLSLTPDRDKKDVRKAIDRMIKKEKDNEVLISIAQALPYLPAKNNEKVLVDLLRRSAGDIRLKIAAVTSLESFGWIPKKEEDRIYNLVAHRDWPHLGEINSKQKHRVLINLLKTGDEETALGVIEALEIMELGKYRSDYIAALRTLYRHDSLDLKTKVITTLGIHNDGKALALFRQVWTEGNGILRDAIIDAFDLWGSHVGVRGLISLVPTANEEELEKIERVLAFTPNTKQAIKELTRGFESKIELVRRVTTSAAREVTSDLLVPFLVEEMYGERFVRLNAVEFLERMNWVGDDPQDLLQYNIIRNNWAEAAEFDAKLIVNAMNILVEELEYLTDADFTGLPQLLAAHKQSTPYMRKLLQSDSKLLRLHAIQILGYNTAEKDSIKYTLPLSTDSDRDVRLLVASVVVTTSQQISAKQKRKVALTFLQDELYEVRIQALNILRDIVTAKDMTLLMDYVKATAIIETEKILVNEIMSLHLTDPLKVILKRVDRIDPVLLDIAIEQLSRNPSEETIAALQSVLTEGNEAQVIIALSVLAKVDMDRYIGDLTRKFKDPSGEIRYRSLIAVGHSIPQDSLSNFVLPFLKDTDARVRYLASEILLDRNYPIETDDDRYYMLISTCRWEEATAIRPFDDYMEDRMMEAMQSEVQDIVYLTGIAMAKLARTSTQLLGDMLFTDNDKQREAVQHEILGLGADVGSILADAYDRHTELHERQRLMELMGQITSEVHEDKFIELVKSSFTPPEMRDLAMEYLLDYDSLKAVPTFIEMLDHESTVLQQQAADELVDIGEGAVISLLAALREKPHIRSKVITVLGRLGSEMAILDLSVHLKSPDLDVRHAAGLSLQRIGWSPEVISDRVIFYAATERWSRVIHLGDDAMLELISMVQTDPIPAVRDKAAEAMRTIWPSLPEQKAQEYIKRFKRMLGPDSHEVYEFLINFGVINKDSTIRKIFRSIANLITSNLYYLLSIISGLFLVGVVNSLVRDPSLYFQLQLTLLSIIVGFQLVQALFITNYAEKFIKLVERVGSVVGRGKNASIWANKNFSLIVGLIFVSSLYQFLTKPGDTGARSFIDEQETLIGQIMIRFVAGDFGFFDFQSIQIPDFGISAWFGLFDLPELRFLFNETNLSLILRGAIFLAIAWEVRRVGIRAVWLQDPIPNNPSRFYQKLALPIGTLLFYMLAFVEESVYATVNEPLKFVPLQVAQLGILAGSFSYLLVFSKDKPQGWSTVLSSVITLFFLKFVEVLLVDEATNPFATVQQPVQIRNALLGVLAISVIVALLTWWNTRALRSQHSPDNSTISFMVRYQWSILIMTSLSYFFLFGVNLLGDQQTSQIYGIVGVLLSSVVSSFIVFLWFLRNFRHRSLRLHSIVTLLPVFGLLYFLSDRNGNHPVFYYFKLAEDTITSVQLPFISSITLGGQQYASGLILVNLVGLFLIFLSYSLFKRTGRVIIENAGIEGIQPRIRRRVRTSRTIWTLYITSFFIIYAFPFYTVLFGF